jgi:hypothetical protein
MRKIKEYQVLFNNDILRLNEIVNNQIKKGWEPLGSLSIQNYEHKIDQYNTKRVKEFYQIVVLYEN